jgi:hypothetical protein
MAEASTLDLQTYDDEILKKNIAEIKQFPKIIIKAIKEYTDHGDINGSLRQNDLCEVEKEKVEILDSAFALVTPLEKDIITYRGIDSTIELGFKTTDKGYVSTAVNTFLPLDEDFIGDNCCLFVILVPKGNRVLRIDDFIMDDGDFGEVLLYRDCTFEVMSFDEMKQKCRELGIDESFIEKTKSYKQKTFFLKYVNHNVPKVSKLVQTKIDKIRSKNMLPGTANEDYSLLKSNFFRDKNSLSPIFSEKLQSQTDEKIWLKNIFYLAMKESSDAFTEFTLALLDLLLTSFPWLMTESYLKMENYTTIKYIFEKIQNLPDYNATVETFIHILKLFWLDKNMKRNDFLNKFEKQSPYFKNFYEFLYTKGFNKISVINELFNDRQKFGNNLNKYIEFLSLQEKDQKKYAEIENHIILKYLFHIENYEPVLKYLKSNPKPEIYETILSRAFEDRKEIEMIKILEDIMPEYNAEFEFNLYRLISSQQYDRLAKLAEIYKIIPYEKTRSLLEKTQKTNFELYLDNLLDFVNKNPQYQIYFLPFLQLPKRVRIDDEKLKLYFKFRK